MWRHYHLVASSHTMDTSIHLIVMQGWTGPAKRLPHNLPNFLAHKIHSKCPNKHYICVIMSPTHKTLTDRSPMNCLHCRKFVPAWCSGSIFEFVLVRKIGVNMYFLLTTWASPPCSPNASENLFNALLWLCSFICFSSCLILLCLCLLQVLYFC